MINRHCDRSQNRKGTESGEKSGDEEPATTDFGESSDVRKHDREWKVQRTHEGISKILDIGEFLVTVMNQKCSCEDTKNK